MDRARSASTPSTDQPAPSLNLKPTNRAFLRRLRYLRQPEYRQFIRESIREGMARPFEGQWGGQRVEIPTSVVANDMTRFARRDWELKQLRELRETMRLELDGGQRRYMQSALVARLLIDPEYGKCLLRLDGRLREGKTPGRIGPYASADGRLRVEWWILRDDMHYVRQNGLPDIRDETQMEQIRMMDSNRVAAMVGGWERPAAASED